MGASVFRNRDYQEFEEIHFDVEQERKINMNPVRQIRYPRSEQYFDSLEETNENEQMLDSNVLSRMRLGNRVEFELTITLNQGIDKRQFFNEMTALLGGRGNLIYEDSSADSKSLQQRREFQSNSGSRSISQRESELSRQLHAVINNDQCFYHNKRNSGTKRFSSELSGKLINELEQFRINYERGLVPQTSLQSHLNIMESPKFYGNEYANEDFEVLSPLKLEKATSKSFSPTKLKKPKHKSSGHTSLFQQHQILQ